MRRPRRLTEEQDALRLVGLRVLARLIVCTHLASLLDEEERARSGSAAPADDGHLRTEGEHDG